MNVPDVPVLMRQIPGAWVLSKGLAILYEDRDILVVDKPPGLLTIATERDKSNTAYFILTDYVRKGSARSRNRVFIVHRLDREASGLLVFARNEEAKVRLQGQWDETEKKYLAIVHGRCGKASGIITSYLAENRAHTVYSTTDAARGKLSRTAYRVLREANRFSLLEVDLRTGRKHQIRVQLADSGHPIVGDRKYGRGDTTSKRMALHAHSLSFRHPFTGRRLTFTAKPPGHFKALVPGIDLSVPSPPGPDKSGTFIVL